MLKRSVLFLFFISIGPNCFGQSTPISCVANGGVNMPVRAEGLAESVGDFLVICTGGTPTGLGVALPTTDIRIILNTYVTSKLLSGPWSEALLMVDEPAPGTQRLCGTAGDTESTPGVCTITGTGTGAGVYSGAAGRPNVFQGLVSPNNILFSGIPVDPPGNSGTRVFRITNVRANANYLGAGPVNEAPTSITETITAVPPNYLPIFGLAIQAVGAILQGMNVSVGTISLPQGSSQNLALVGDPTSSGVSQLTLRFHERFTTSLKKRNIATSAATPTALANQNDLMLGSYSTESGLVNTSFPTVANRGNLAIAGVGDSGTRLMARFAQVPPGVLLFSKVTATVSNGPDVVRMVSTDVNGAGPYSPVAGNSFGIAPIPVVNGFATALYEVVESDPNTFATVDIPIYVAYTSNVGMNLPGPGTATVTLRYAPVSGIGDASGVESVPRFVDSSSAMNAFTIEPPHCTTLGAGSASFSASAGSSSFSVTAAGGCNWFPVALDNWITVSTPGPFSGNGTVNYSVAANISPSVRSGTIALRYVGQPAIPDQPFTVNQSGIVCAYSLSPTGRTFLAAGGSGAITVNANSPLCPFPTVTPNNSYITVNSVNFTNGVGTVSYSVDAETGASRTGTISIDGKTFTIIQQGGSVPSPGSVDSTSGSGAAHTFVFTFSDSGGAQDLSILNILINSALDGRNACYLAYDRANNILYLVGDNGGGLSGLTLTGSGSVNNSQCTVNGVGSSGVMNGTTLTLTLSLAFNQTNFAGEKITYMAARDVAQNNSGWVTMGVWTVPALASPPLAIVSATPSHGSGASQQFAVTFRDPTSSANLRTTQLLINSDLNGDLACYLGYDHVNNVIYLVDDFSPTLLLPGIVPNSGTGTVGNSQCAISGAGTTKSESGTDLTLTVNLTFKSSFSGPKIVFSGVQTLTNANSGWRAMGFWNVP